LNLRQSDVPYHRNLPFATGSVRIDGKLSKVFPN
jgi:hypothetical protein